MQGKFIFNIMMNNKLKLKYISYYDMYFSILMCI